MVPRRRLASWARPRSIRTQLVGLVAVIALPMVGLLAHASLQRYRLAVSLGEQEVIRVAEAVGTATRQFTSQAESQLTAAGRVLAPRLLEKQACLELAAPLREALGFVTGVNVVDSAGRFVCSTHPFPSPSLPDVAGSEWFLRVRETRAFVIGAPQISKVTGDTWVSVLGAPILNASGAFQGAVSSGISLEHFDELLAGVTIPPSALVTLTNAEGRIIARSIDPEKFVGGSLPSPLQPARPVRPNLSLSSGPDLDGIDRTWSRLRLPELGWSVQVGLPTELILGPVRSALVRDAGAGVASIGGALALALLFYTRISASLSQLAEGTSAAADGRAVPLPEGALQEVLQVGEQLNSALAARSRAEEAERELRHALETKNAELEVKNAELETKNAELEQFTYTVSHDLKAPLVTISGFTGLLERSARGGDAERLLRDIGHIKHATVTMQRLLNELLELSRVGRVANDFQPVDLSGVVTEAIATVGGGTGALGNRVSFSVAPDLPIVWGDRTRLAQLLQNLIENAVKFMGDQPSPRIEVGASPGESGIEAFVRDNGIGIERTHHTRVFGLFDRLSPEGEGTGIGLALAKRIVEAHGGRIWIESAGAGQGSTFFFTLPAGPIDP